jgi:hypothetical protein
MTMSPGLGSSSSFVLEEKIKKTMMSQDGPPPLLKIKRGVSPI